MTIDTYLSARRLRETCACSLSHEVGHPSILARRKSYEQHQQNSIQIISIWWSWLSRYRYNFNLPFTPQGNFKPYTPQLSWMEMSEISSSTVCYENDFPTWSVLYEKEIHQTKQPARRRSWKTPTKGHDSLWASQPYGRIVSVGRERL